MLDTPLFQQQIFHMFMSDTVVYFIRNSSRLHFTVIDDFKGI